MNEMPPINRESYYREAASWNRDRLDAIHRSRRTAWSVAAGAGLIALFEALAIMLMMPLKTVEPYTLLVDRQTGYVQNVKPLEPARVSGDTALTQSFLVQYVLARESFDIDALQANYRKVALWSADTARSRYLASMQASNPDSPLRQFPRTTLVETVVKSVSPLAANTAFVRFERRRVDAGGAPESLGHYVAVVRYRFAGEPMKVADRYLNPLGFQVTRYQRNPEALPEPVAPAPAATNAPPASTPPPAFNPSVVPQ